MTENNFKNSFLVLLGTGTPNAEPERSGPAVAVIDGNQSYLVDCGPGIVRRAQTAFKQGVKALHPRLLDKLFLTHLHSDHTLGYADLIFTPWVLHREKRLKVFGPEGTELMTQHIVKAYQEDVRERINSPEPIDPVGYQPEVSEIHPGLVYRDDRISIEAIKVNHGELPSFAYKFSTGHRTFVISGDTTYCENLIEFARGCDVLVHEVYSSRGLKSRDNNWINYHRNYHTSPQQLVNIARMVKPGILVLYHCLFHGVTPEILEREITDNYSGEVVIGNDLERF